MRTQLCWSPDSHGSEAEDRRGGNADRRDQAAGETTTRLRGARLTDEVALHKGRAYLGARSVQRASAVPASVLSIAPRRSRGANQRERDQTDRERDDGCQEGRIHTEHDESIGNA